MDDIIKFVDGLLEQSTPDSPAWNIEHKLEKQAPKWNYIDGCMLKAIMDLYYSTENKKYLEFVIDYIDFYVNDSGEILGYEEEDYNCDNINEGKILFDLYKITGNKKYELAINKLYNQVKNQPRTKEGNFWHKKIYPNQIWLDGLYMVQPFYMEYETVFNQNNNYLDVCKQFDNVYEIMKDKETGLMFHGYSSTRDIFWADSETGLSKNFWTRSIGWYCMALVDTTEKLSDMFFYEYDKLQKHLKEIIDSLLVYMDKEEKMFYQVTNMQGREGNYLETSGTCAISYAILKGVRLGYLPKSYEKIGLEIFEAVKEKKLVINDGTFVLKDICLVAGLGGMPGKGSYKERDGSYEYYISEPIVDNDAKGVAPFLFAYSEVLRRR